MATHSCVSVPGRFNDAIRSGRIHHIEAIDNCCILAAVGQQMASRKGVSATMFSALAKSNINIRYGSKAWPPCSPAARVNILRSRKMFTLLLGVNAACAVGISGF